ncbi:expressed protein [Phakopsora pachyrhizi]|uniref:Expressed protein n=1 Tax=Phakopsora pachyrhizi TaxID=170000 RepID=A0AAV0B5Q1_PHAPC|nr:expressed protein [Phakopsora pachyrhizi]
MASCTEKRGISQVKDLSVIDKSASWADGRMERVRSALTKDGATMPQLSESQAIQRSRRVKRSVIQLQRLHTSRPNAPPPLSISSFKISPTFTSHVNCSPVTPVLDGISSKAEQLIVPHQVYKDDLISVGPGRSYSNSLSLKPSNVLDDLPPTSLSSPFTVRGESEFRNAMDRFDLADCFKNSNPQPPLEERSSFTCTDPTSVKISTSSPKTNSWGSNVVAKPAVPLVTAAMLKSCIKSSSIPSSNNRSSNSVPATMHLCQSTASKSFTAVSSSPTSYNNPFYSSTSTLSTSPIIAHPSTFRRPLQTGFKRRRPRKWWIENNGIKLDHKKSLTAEAPSQGFIKPLIKHQQAKGADNAQLNWSRNRITNNTCHSEDLKDWFLDLSVENHILMMYASSIMRSCVPFSLYDPSHDPSSQSNFKSSLPSKSNNSAKLKKSKVLDVGCGPSATWCVGVLRSNVGIEVIGLDICPVLLDCSQLESVVSENLSFVQDDFLSGNLPFEDSSFDYVHASFISSGIPETHWPFVIEEMTRVLKPGCPLELLDCNLFIPEISKTTKLQDIQGDFIDTQPRDSIRNPHQDNEKNQTKTSEGSTSVPQAIQELLDRHFVSPFPLSLIPAQLSMFSTGMQRPLFNKFIKLPEGNTTSESTMHGTLKKGENLVDDYEAVKAESMARVLIQSRIDSLYANKELVWEESPTAQAEVSSNQKPITGSEIKFDSTVLKSERSSGGEVNVGTVEEGNHLASRRSKVLNSELQSHRKRFDRVWSSWKDSMDSNTVGISKLLESRFGWTCTMDQKHHEVLDRQYRYYRSELELCEDQLSFKRQSSAATLPDFLHGQTRNLNEENATKNQQREYKEQNISNEALLSKKSELKKLMQSIQSDLMNVKKRLGLINELHHEPRSFKTKNDHMAVKKAQYYTNELEISASKKATSEVAEDYGKINVE